MNILLVGASLNSGNRGVNALTRGTINAIYDKYGQGTSIKILSYTAEREIDNGFEYKEKTNIIQEIPCLPYPSLRLAMKCILGKIIPNSIFMSFIKKNKLFKHIYDADIIFDISEGDSFSDIYGFKRFIIHSTIKITTILLNKKIVLLPQTIGPFKNYFVKKLAKYILNNVSYIFVRDMISYNIVVDSMKVSRDKVKYIPDMAFYMNPDLRIGLKDISESIIENDKILIGLNVSGLLYNGGYNKSNMFGLKVDYKELIDDTISEILKNDKNQILLVPHVITDMEIEDDLRVCERIYNEFNKKYAGRIYTVKKEYKEHELKSLISKCDFFIGARMHACIAAISSNVATTPIAYSRKFVGIWRELGLEECVADPRYHEKEHIINIIRTSLEKRIEINQKLIHETSDIKQKIISLFSYI